LIQTNPQGTKMDNPQPSKRHWDSAQLNAIVKERMAMARQHADALLETLNLSPAEKKFARYAGERMAQLVMDLYCPALEMEPTLRLCARSSATAYALDYVRNLEPPGL
jgi:hypothetical protein